MSAQEGGERGKEKGMIGQLPPRPPILPIACKGGRGGVFLSFADPKGEEESDGAQKRQRSPGLSRGEEPSV